MPESTVADELRRWLKVLTILTAALYLVLGGAVAYVYVDSGNKRDQLKAQQVQLKAQQAQLKAQQVRITSALCVTRGDLRQRVKGSKEFLKTHPNGAPSLGITAATIRLSISMEESTLKALASVRCGGR